MKHIHQVVYTTQYRKGSDQFKIIAETLAHDLMKEGKENVICTPIVTKKDLTKLFSEIKIQGNQIQEFHFVGHSGMYGPMYGSVSYPEQYSPHEIRYLEIPFSSDAKAFFHCCRSARWFAPFFARTKGVTTYGYYYYTTFTVSNKYYKRIRKDSQKMYAIGCAGRKSHGYLGSLKKHLGMQPLEELKQFLPNAGAVDSTYNEVADLYDAVFQDIKVREDEWKWIKDHLPKDRELKVLDIGCGNGALLKELSPRISEGIGVDLSPSIIQRAEQLNASNTNIRFKSLDGPQLPVEDQSVDVIISMLSFRYLDWDPIMDEVRRVLKPGGKILILDMVAVPAKFKEFPKLIWHKWKHRLQRRRYPDFAKNLKQLVSHPAWKKMLEYNPIRSEHEMKWYLESRFPGQKVEKINIGYHSCILAFDSGDIRNITDIKLSYP